MRKLDIYTAFAELVTAAEAAGWDTDKANAPILDKAREALADLHAQYPEQADDEEG